MKQQILFEEILEDRKLGIVLDSWNKTYEYEFHPIAKGKFLREDLQCADESSEMTLKEIVEFYIEQIENKISCDPDNDWSSFEQDLKVLKGAIIYKRDGMVLVAKKCKSCGDNLRYSEYIDGYNYCEDCEGEME